MTTTDTSAPARRTPEEPGHPSTRGGGHIRDGRNLAGWLFVTPTLVVLGLFLVIPILMALWVSFTDWNGKGSPFASGIGFVGGDNYQRLFTELVTEGK